MAVKQSILHLALLMLLMEPVYSEIGNANNLLQLQAKIEKKLWEAPIVRATSALGNSGQGLIWLKSFARMIRENHQPLVSYVNRAADKLASQIEEQHLLQVEAAAICGPGNYKETSTCKSCPSGYYQDKSESTSCIECRSTCAFGFTLGPPCQSGSTTNRDCFTCPTWCNEGYYLTDSCECMQCTSVKCLAGTYATPCDGRTRGDVRCEACPLNYYQDKDGASSCIKMQDCTGPHKNPDFTTAGKGQKQNRKCTCDNGYELSYYGECLESLMADRFYLGIIGILIISLFPIIVDLIYQFESKMLEFSPLSPYTLYGIALVVTMAFWISGFVITDPFIASVLGKVCLMLAVIVLSISFYIASRKHPKPSIKNEDKEAGTKALAEKVAEDLKSSYEVDRFNPEVDRFNPSERSNDEGIANGGRKEPCTEPAVSDWKSAILSLKNMLSSEKVVAEKKMQQIQETERIPERDVDEVSAESRPGLTGAA